SIALGMLLASAVAIAGRQLSVMRVLVVVEAILAAVFVLAAVDFALIVVQLRGSSITNSATRATYDLGGIRVTAKYLATAFVLASHGISQDDEHIWNPALYMSQEALRHRMELLIRNDCSVLPLAEAVARLDRNDLPPRAIAITFDDGCHDFFARAYPVIRHFGFPVTVYQTSYYCVFNGPVFGVACSYILWKGAGKRIDGLRFTGTPELLDLSTEESRSSDCRRIRKAARRDGRSAVEKSKLIDQLAVSLQAAYGVHGRKRL